jgi:hypothetical protein
MVVSAGAILYATLRQGDGSLAGVTCLLAGETWLADGLRNILLFLPLGLGLAMAGLGRSRLLVIAAVLSAGIEALQFTVVPGRCTSPSDLLANVLGALAGWAVWQTVELWRAGDPRCGRVAVALLAAWWLQCAVTSWGLRPWIPDSLTYFGQWAHVFPGYVPLPARVMDVRLGSLPIPDDSLADTPTAKRFLHDSSIVLAARTDGLADAHGLAQIAALTDAERRFASLGQQECRVQALASIHAERIGLETITLSTTPVCAPPPAEVLTTMRYDGRRFSLTVRGDTGVLGRTVVALSPALGWALIRPLTASGSVLEWMTLCWISIGFALPIGLLAVRGRTWSRGRVVLAIAAMWTGLLVPPLVLHTGHATIAEFATAAAALAAGASLSRMTRSGQ